MSGTKSVAPERPTFAAVLASLDDATIASNTELDISRFPKFYIERCLETSDGKRRFCVAGIRDGNRSVLLYVQNDRIFGVQGLAISAARQEVWWFCEGDIMAVYLETAIKDEKKKAEARSKAPAVPKAPQVPK
jgi:hypothetical protein